MKAFRSNPEDFLPDIIKSAEQKVDLRTTRKFRKGRTWDYSRRMQEYGFDEITELYYIKSNDRAKFVESVLVDTFQDRRKCVNKRRNGGSFSRECCYFVYTSTWYKRQSNSI